MLRAITLAGVFIIVSSAVMSVTPHSLRDFESGRLGFRIWRALSPQAHGGHLVTVNDIRIYYETYGNGPPVLVLHGGLGSIEDMHRQIGALSAEWLVIAPDSRGHGRSTDSEAPLSYGQMADDTVKMLDALDLDQVDLVGWSDGGIIGLDIAMHHPERIRHLIVIGANYNVAGLKETPRAVETIPPRPLLNRFSAPGPAQWPVLYRKVVTMWRTQPNYSLEDLRRIRAPTLVIAGEFDAIWREHTDQLAKAIPGAEELVIPGGTHFVLSEKPDIVNAHILRFLQSWPP